MADSEATQQDSSTLPQGHVRTGRPRVVIIGSGFGGIFAAKELADAEVDVTLISATTYHLFQPLLYQVATGILSEGLIAPMTREVLARQKNTEVVYGTVDEIELKDQTVTATTLGIRTVYDYDYLIVAAGAGQSYFGHPEFAEWAPGMKTIDDALELRGRIFGAFELAEVAAASGRHRDVEKMMTFVVVGAGATGVELAGQIAELSERTLKHNFRNIASSDARIVLLDGADQVLPAFGDHLGKKAQQKLEQLGVEVQLGGMVVGVDADGLNVEFPDGRKERINSVTKVWAAGVQASPLGKVLADQSGAELDRAGRIKVDPDLTVPGYPDVFVVGDMISLDNLPGVSPVAIQGGKFAAHQIEKAIKGEQREKKFKYFDKGSMATISRFSAVASVGKLRFSGFLAWLLWLGVHLFYIIGFKNQIGTFLHWAVSFLGRARGERTATEQQVFARNALKKLQGKYPPGIRVGEGRPLKSSRSAGDLDAGKQSSGESA